MATEIQILSQKYFKQWNNGDDYSLDTTNFVTNLAGLVMQKIKIIQEIKIKWRSKMVAANDDPANMQWVVSQPSSTILEIERNDGGDFLKDGFFVNDDVRTINRSQSLVNQTFNGGIITLVTKKLMNISFLSAQPTLQSDIKSWVVVGETPLTSLVYNYGLIENNDSFSTNSLITNENQGWYTPSTIPSFPLSLDMEGLGLPKSWKNGGMTVSKKSTVTDTFITWQHFQIEHTFIIPYFNAGGVDDLEDNIVPDWLDGLNSLKYVFDAEFRTVLSNPNTAKKQRVENVLGSVGYFNETFNGFDSNYEITSLNYRESTTLDSADGILISGTTKVTIFVEKLSGNFNANDIVKIYFSYLPELQSEIENTQTNFETNFMYDNIRTEMGAAATTGTGILNNCLSITPTSSNIAVITFETTLTTAQKLRLDNTKKFLIGVEVGDSTIIAGNSDVTILKVLGTFDESPDIPDLMTFTALNFPYSEAQNKSLGFTDFKGYNEHGLAIKGTFDLDLTKDAFINSFKACLVAHNPISNSYFIIDEYNYQLPQTVSGGVQQLNMSTTRVYQLASGSEKNLIAISLVSSTSSNVSYEFNFAQKIRWENWMKNTDVDTVFFNNSEPNDNFNHKTSNYSNLNGYEIKMLYLFSVNGKNALGVAGTTEYRFFSPNFTIFDYDKDGNATPAFTQVIETFDATTMTNLGGAVLVGQDTLFRITWTWSGGALTDITTYWVIHRIEKSEAIGQQIMEFGSAETNETTNNLLKAPLTRTLVSGLMVTECLIDGTKTQNIDYNLSGEINSPTSTGTPTPTGEVKTLNTGENKTLNTGENKTLNI